METIKIWNERASDGQLRDIAARLGDGQLAIIPTDTTYAIVTDALDPKAVERLCRLKGINPEKTNLSIICDSISMASDYARIDNASFRLMRDCCPGPYTFIFRAAQSLPRAFRSRKTVGIRIPDNAFDTALVAELGHPLITTSIEFDDEDHAVSPGLIAESYEGRVDFMVEAEEGSTELSTIIDCTGHEPEIVRQGKGDLLHYLS